MRASDSDRQRAIDELRRHCAAGRIDVDEFAARIEAVHGAVTLEELEAVRADLPMMRVAGPAGGGGVWARSAGLPSTGLATGDAQEEAIGAARRLLAVLIAAVSVLVVAGAVAMAFASEWVWALILLIGWVIGVAQGRAIPRRR
jgi:hypothetical protein